MKNYIHFIIQLCSRLYFYEVHKTDVIFENTDFLQRFVFVRNVFVCHLNKTNYSRNMGHSVLVLDIFTFNSMGKDAAQWRTESWFQIPAQS